MNFSKISKIMLIFLILVVFMNIAFASDDAIADGNVTLADDSSSIAIAQDTSVNEDVLSVESDNSLPSDDLEGMSGEDAVSAYNRPHLHVSYRFLNDTVYVDDVFRVEVNVTNDGNTPFPVGYLKLGHSHFSGEPTDHVDFQSDDWQLTEVWDFSYHLDLVNTKPLNVGDSLTYYADITYTYPTNDYSLDFSASYSPYGNYVYIDEEDDYIRILAPNVTMTKESVNGVRFYVGDEIIYNITIVNNDYGKDRRTWKNLILQDIFPLGLKLDNCEFYNSNGELITLNHEFNNYNRTFFASIPELADSLTIQLKFKAFDAGDMTNSAILLKTTVESYAFPLAEDESLVHVLPHINFTKEALNPVAYAGQIVTFKLTVNNTWDRDISNFRISDKLDEYFSYESYEGQGWVKTGDYTFKYTGTLAPGDVSVLTVNVKVDEDIPLIPQNPMSMNEMPLIWTNTASLIHDGEVVQASANVNVFQQHMVLYKRCLNDTVNLGDNVTFEMYFYDWKHVEYPYMEIIDTPVNGLEFLSCYAIGDDGEKVNVTYVVEGSKIIFKVHDFNVSARIYATFRTTETGMLLNGAGLRNSDESSYMYDSVWVNASLNVEKTVFVEDDSNFNGFYANDNITYMVKVTNDNNFDLTNIVMNESYPENLTFLGFEGENWTRTGDNTFTYNGKLAPKNSTFIYLKFKINRNTLGLIKNTVTVGSDETDNVSASCPVAVREPRIWLSKRTVEYEVLLGDIARFAIMAESDTDHVFYDVDILDIVPEGLEFLRCFVVDDDGNEVPLEYSFDGSNVIITIDKINQSRTVYTEFRTLEIGSFENCVALPNHLEYMTGDRVYVYAPLSIYKSLDTSSQSGGGISPAIPLEPLPLLKGVSYPVVRPSGFVPSVISGGEAVFNIEVYNGANYNLTGIVVTDVLPEGFEIISFSGENWQRISENSFKYLGNLTPDEEARFSVTCKVPDNVTGEFVNRATAKANETDNVSTSCPFNVIPKDINLEKISLNDTVNIGDKVYFDILVKNIPQYVLPGPIFNMPRYAFAELVGAPEEYVEGYYHYRILHDVEVVDTVPEGLEFESCYAVDQFGDVISIDCKVDGNKVIFTIPELVKSVTIKTTFKAIGQGNQVNTAEIPGNPPSSDKVFVNNSNMTVEKLTNNQTVYVGEQVSFTIIVKNTGTTDLSEVFVEDTNYTAGIVYDSYANKTGSGWKYSNGKFFYQGILKVGESASFDVIFNTTKIGNFNNTVVAGSNSTDNVTATNTTNVIGNVTEDPENNKTSGGNDKDLDDDDVTNPKKPTGSDDEETTTDSTKPTGSNAEVSNEDDPSTSSTSDDEMDAGVTEGENSVKKSSPISNELTTGNPILALLMVLISIVGVVRYSKK